jgi:hypothetical protein
MPAVVLFRLARKRREKRKTVEAEDSGDMSQES